MDRFSRPTRDWFLGAFSAPTPAQNGAWNAISSGAHALVVAPTGSGKTLAAFLWALDRLLVSAPAEPESLPGLDDRERPPAEGAQTQHPGALHFAAQGARRRRRTQPSRPADRDHPDRQTPRPARAADHRGRPLRRHPGVGPPLAAEQPAGHPDHHARIAVPHADVQGAGDAERGGHHHRRRGPRRRRHQTRRPSGRVAGTPRRPAAQAGPADRALGHRGAQGACGAVPRRLRAGGDRGPAVEEDLGPDRLGPGGGHVRSAGRGRRVRLRPGVRAAAAGVDLAARGGEDRGPGAGQPVHHCVRQFPPPRRTPHRPAQRDLRRAAAHGGRRRLGRVRRRGTRLRSRPGGSTGGRRCRAPPRGPDVDGDSGPHDGAGRQHRRARIRSWPAPTTARSPRTSGP